MAGYDSRVDYTQIVNNMIKSGSTNFTPYNPKVDYASVVNEQMGLASMNINPALQQIYRDISDTQKKGVPLISSYDKTANEFSQTKNYVDNMRDFERWMYGNYGFNVDVSRFDLLVKQYNYNKERERKGLFAIDFSDPAYDPDQHSTLQNEFYQFATQELGKKTDPRMAQYLFPEWINEKYAKNDALSVKEKAELLGLTYKSDMTFPELNYDYAALGFKYGNDAEDRKRKEYGLPPQSFLDLYASKEQLASGQAPQVLQNTNSFVSDYQDFMSELQKLADKNEVSYMAVEALYNKYATFSALDDYFEKLEKHNADMLPGSDGYDSYNAKLLSGKGVDAPISPVLESVLQQAGFNASFLDDIYLKAREAQEQVVAEQKALEKTFWSKVGDWMLGRIQNFADNSSGFLKLFAPAAEAVQQQKERIIKSSTEKAQRIIDDQERAEEQAAAYTKQIIDALKRESGYKNYVKDGLSVTEQTNAKLGGAVIFGKRVGVNKETDIMALINNPRIQKEAALAEVNGGTPQAAYKYSFVTDDEANALRYYYGKNDMDGFNDFLASIEDALDKRAYLSLTGNLQSFAEEKGPAGEITAAALSVVAGMIAPVTWIDTMLRPTNDETINQYASVAQQIGLFANDTRQISAGTSSPVAQFFIQTGLSIVDMVSKLPFGPTAALTWMASSAAGLATSESLQKGATPQQAALYGTVVGAIEYVTEKIPIDRLFTLSTKFAAGGLTKATLKTAVSETLKQAGIEATEELVAEYAGQLADIALMGPKSDFWQYVATLTASGMSENEAFTRASARFFVEQPVIAALGGALSGAILGGTFTARAVIDNNAQYDAAQRDAAASGVQPPTTGPMPGAVDSSTSGTSAAQGIQEGPVRAIETTGIEVQDGQGAAVPSKGAIQADVNPQGVSKVTAGASVLRETNPDPYRTEAIRAEVNSAISYAQKTGNAKNAKPLTEIVRTVKDWLESPISTKIFNRPKGARVSKQTQGWYQEYRDAIGLRETFALSTLFHEIGHKMDTRYGLRSETKELEKTYLSSRITDNYKPNEYSSEMVADFFRDYFLNPEAARKNAPTFFAMVESKLSKNDKTQAGKVQQMLADFMAQSIPGKIASHTVEYGEKPKSTTAQSIKKVLDVLEVGLFSETAPIDQFSKEVALLGDKAVADNPSVWANYAGYSANVASQIITNKMIAPMKRNGEVGDVIDNRSFASLFKWLGDGKAADARLRRQTYLSYLIAQHAIERADQGKDALPKFVATTEQLREQVAKWEVEYPEMKGHAAELHDWWYTFIKAWMVDTGLWDIKTYALWKETNPNYVPFYRQLSEQHVSYGKFGSNGFSGILAPVKGAKKSDLPILDPIASMHRDIVKYVSAISRRRVMQAVASAVDANPAGLNDWVVEVTARTKADKQRLTEIKQLFKNAITTKYGQSEIDAEQFIEEILPGETMTMFRKMTMRDGAELNVLTVVGDNGEQRYFYTENPAFFEALASLDPAQVNVFFRGMGKIMNMFKGSVTFMNPFFSAPNFLRDAGERLIWGSQKHVGEYAYDLGAAAIDVFRKSELGEKYKQMGGGGDAGLYTEAGTQKTINQDTMPFKTLSKPQQVGRVLKVPLQVVEAFNGALEAMNRSAEFKRAKKQGDSDIEAFNKAMEVTLNFRRRGKWAKHLDPIIPFYNAMMQDLYKTIRLVDNANTPTGRRQLSKVIVRLLWSQTMFGVLEALLHAMDKDYEDLPGNIKDAYWILWKNENGAFIKVPKPASVFPRFFSGIGTRATEYIQGDMDAFEGFGTSMQSQILPSTLLDPVIAIGNNTTWYGGQIENYFESHNLQSWARFDENTSNIAKSIGWFTGQLSLPLPGVTDGLSPKELQYLIDQYTGVIGDVILPFTTPSTQGSRIENLVGSRLIVDPVFSNKQMGDFYSYTDSIAEAIDTLETTGRVQNVIDPELFIRKAEEIVGGAIKRGNKLIKEYKADVAELDARDLPRDEHAQEARRLRSLLNDKLREVNKELSAFKKAYMK